MGRRRKKFFKKRIFLSYGKDIGEYNFIFLKYRDLVVIG